MRLGCAIFAVWQDAARAEFDSRKPYDYLQICYYQTGQLQRAAAAAFTHLAWNPGNRAAKDNLQFYLDQVNSHMVLIGLS